MANRKPQGCSSVDPASLALSGSSQFSALSQGYRHPPTSLSSSVQAIRQRGSTGPSVGIILTDTASSMSKDGPATVSPLGLSPGLLLSPGTSLESTTQTCQCLQGKAFSWFRGSAGGPVVLWVPGPSQDGLTLGWRTELEML